jgi:hypothetical protein
MTFLRNTWYVAMWGEALVADGLVPRTLLKMLPACQPRCI